MSDTAPQDPGTVVGEPQPVPTGPVTPTAPDSGSGASPAPDLVKGQLVVLVYDSPYDGNVVRYGLVLDLPQVEGAAPTAIIGWLEGPSGPIQTTELQAL